MIVFKLIFGWRQHLVIFEICRRKNAGREKNLNEVNEVQRIRPRGVK